MANRTPRFNTMWTALMGKLQAQGGPLPVASESKRHALYMQADFNRWRAWLRDKHPGELCAQAEDATCAVHERKEDGAWFLVFTSADAMQKKMLASVGIGTDTPTAQSRPTGLYNPPPASKELEDEISDIIWGDSKK